MEFYLHREQVVRWNRLPEEVVEAGIITTLKKKHSDRFMDRGDINI